MLWTDITDPATLTGYARAALQDIEATKGTLAQWLPNREVPSIDVRFVKGQNGLVNVANFRAYDAEIEVGKRQAGQRVVIELPALGQNIPVSEYEQLRAQGGVITEAQALVSIQNTTKLAVQAVSDSIELLRGTVIDTGKATIDQYNYQSDDDFGRPASHSFTAPALWSVAGTDRLTQLQTWCDLYEDTNGEPPGALLMSRKAFRALGTGTQFQTQLLNGGARNATEDQVRDMVTAAGLPPIYLYNRRVQVEGVTTKPLNENKVFLLPAPVGTDQWASTQLGATFWGRTLSSMEPGWGIEAAEQPGVVAGVWKNDKPPMGLEIISDAIALPVMANAALSMSVTVL